MSEREKLRSRFARASRPQVEVRRRGDYKGLRSKVSFRLPLELAHQLDLLKVAAGIDKNDLAVTAIGDAVARELTAVRETFDDEAWEVVVRCARANAGENEGH